jgi:hypothetical protein
VGRKQRPQINSGDRSANTHHRLQTFFMGLKHPCLVGAHDRDTAHNHGYFLFLVSNAQKEGISYRFFAISGYDGRPQACPLRLEERVIDGCRPGRSSLRCAGLANRMNGSTGARPPGKNSPLMSDPMQPQQTLLPPVFQGREEFSEFARSATQDLRYFRSGRVDRFLKAVLLSSRDRELRIPTGEKVWRARVGCKEVRVELSHRYYTFKDYPFESAEMKQAPVRWDVEGR